MINPQPRLRWRVLVGPAALPRSTPSRPSRPLSWDLLTCSDAARVAAHGEEDRRLIATTDDPNGHCLLDGVCPRCGATSRK
jgi:hypothetical protein